MREEEGEVIIEFQGPIDPEKIVKFLEWADDEYSVSVVITHAEFEEFATMALAGGAAGAGAALVAKALGPSVSWPMVALAAGLAPSSAPCPPRCTSGSSATGDIPGSP